MEQYQCSDRLLLESIHRHCPDLQRKTLFADHEFTIKELKARSDYESYMLGLLKKEPSILYLIVVCDESTFVLHGRSKHCDCVQIYCSSEDVSVTDVCCISDLDQDPIKVHFFLAVTAHHTFQPRGVVMYAQCTGTTGINRYHNKHLDASSMVGDWTYQVPPDEANLSHWHDSLACTLPHCAVINTDSTPKKMNKGEAAGSTTEEEMTDLLYLTCKKFHAMTGFWPYLKYDNNNIQVKIGVSLDKPDVYRLRSSHGDDIVMPIDRKLPQPTHSPDCNRPVEHAFGAGKARVINHLYPDKQRVTTGAHLRLVVHTQFTNNMPKAAVKEDIDAYWQWWQFGA